MKIVLIGFMCSGKTRVGRSLAKKLQLPHFDTDDMIAKETGASAGEVIRARGEAAFRAVESSVIRSLGSRTDAVISTGGGAPLDPANWRELSRGASMVWLKVKPETVVKRAGNLSLRPLIDPLDPLSSIKKMLETRLPAYGKADCAVDTDDVSPDDIVKKIFALLHLPAA